MGYIGWASPMSSHFDEVAGPDDPKIKFVICGELYCVSCLVM